MDETSLTLLERIRDRSDQSAWNRFASLYSPFIESWAKRAGLAEADITDITQEVLLVLLKELPGFRYDPDRGRFRGWLKTIVFNKCHDVHRRRTPRQVAEGEIAEAPAVDQWESLWEAEYREHLVHHALRIMRSDFEELTWRACWLTTVEGLSVSETAAQLNMTEAAIYTARSRVFKRLRGELRELLE